MGGKRGAAAEAEADTELDTKGPTEPGLAPGESSAVSEPEPGALESQIESLGKSVSQAESSATAGLDLSEEAQSRAVDRLANMAEDLVLNPVSLVADVRDFMVDLYKARPKPWSASSLIEQREVVAACEQVSEGLVRQIIEVIRADGKKPVRVLLQKVQLGDDITITGKVKVVEADELDEAVMSLHHARGKHVMLTVASLDDYKGPQADVTRDDYEEPPLPFAGGEADQSSLDAKPSSLAENETVDLKTGMVVTEDGGDGAVEREATPAELAWARDQQADFDTVDEAAEEGDEA